MMPDRAMLRSALGDLDVRARRIVEGLRAGNHASPRAGGAVEFDRHRAYQPGDDLRQLDWRVFARSDRLVLKHARQETTLDVHFLLDVSGSMAFDSNGDWGSKHNLQSAVSQALAWLALDAGDRVSIQRCGEGLLDSVQLHGGVQALTRVIDVSTQAIEHGTRLQLVESTSALVQAINRPGLILLMSDILLPLEDFRSALGQLRFAGHDILVMQYLDNAERFFAVPDETRLVDLEGTSRTRIHARELRADYLEALKTHQSEVLAICGAMQVDHVLLDPHESPVGPLRSVLHHRGGSASATGAGSS